MNTPLFEKLCQEELISASSFEKIKEENSRSLFSVHWEIKTLLYLGVLLLTGGLGVLIYKNINTIGHQAILLFILAICIASFYYCFKTKPPFSFSRVVSTGPYYDYVLLLACLTFVIFIGYLQFQFNIFGTRYGLATFLPMLVLFFSAYYFDHLGVLSLAITNLAAWVGITVTPTKLLLVNDFNSSALILTGMGLGIILLAAGFISKHKDWKHHFEFTYTNFGTNVTFVSCLAGLFHFNSLYLLWFCVLCVLSWILYTISIKNKSFYLLIITTLYTYVGLSYVIIRLLDSIDHLDIGVVYLGFLYFIASGAGLIFFLIQSNKKIKSL